MLALTLLVISWGSKSEHDKNCSWNIESSMSLAYCQQAYARMMEGEIELCDQSDGSHRDPINNNNKSTSMTCIKLLKITFIKIYLN